VIGRQSTDGHACPAFRRCVAVELLEWLSHRYFVDGRTDLGRGYLNGDTIVLVDPNGNRSRTVPDAHDRYVLDTQYWTWDVSTPTADVDAGNALLADVGRLVPKPGEECVTIEGCHLLFPAIIDRDAVDGLARPRFRGPVAEVVVAYLNDMFRYFPNGTDRAYWRDDEIIYIGHDDYLHSGFQPEVITIDESGRYCIDRWDWLSPSTERLDENGREERG
jgi:hypothetical protein